MEWKKNEGKKMCVARWSKCRQFLYLRNWLFTRNGQWRVANASAGSLHSSVFRKRSVVDEWIVRQRRCLSTMELMKPPASPKQQRTQLDVLFLPDRSCYAMERNANSMQWIRLKYLHSTQLRSINWHFISMSVMMCFRQTTWGLAMSPGGQRTIRDHQSGYELAHHQKIIIPLARASIVFPLKTSQSKQQAGNVHRSHTSKSLPEARRWLIRQPTKWCEDWPST